MKVKWTPTPGKKDILTIIHDEEEWGWIHVSIFGKTPEFTVDYRSLEEWCEHFAALEYQGAKRFAYKKIAMRSHHSLELAKLFKERLVSSEMSRRVIAEFQSLGYVNDADWVECYVNGLISKRYGPQLIQLKLRSKGISQDIINEIVERLQTEECQHEQIQALLERRYQRKNLKDPKDRQKVIAALIRKGYNLDKILGCLRQFCIF